MNEDFNLDGLISDGDGYADETVSGADEKMDLLSEADSGADRSRDSGGDPSYRSGDDSEDIFSDSNKALWYVVHTYSGHEGKVKLRIDKKVRSRGMQDLVQDIVIPTEMVVETKNSNSRLKNKKLYPGYVIVKMVLTSETWYLIRNTEGVTGFVGHGSAPVPLTDEEVRNMGIDSGYIDYDIEVGDYVRIIDGNFKNYTGTVEQVNKEKRTVRLITTSMVAINCEMSLIEKMN